MDRLLVREFLPLFGVGILTFSVLIASFTILKDAVDYAAKGIPIHIVIQGFLLGLAQVVAYTLPMAVLLGALMAFGRLSSSGEITALRAGGINFLRIAGPVLVCGFFIACFAFIFNERIAPVLTLRAENLIKQAALQAKITLSNKNIAYYSTDKKDGSGFVFAASSSTGDVFNDVKVWKFDKDSSTLYYAKTGIWQQNDWVLTDVHYLTWSPEAKDPVPPVSASAGTLTIDLDVSTSELMAASRNPEELSLAELRIYINQKIQDFQTAQQQLALLEQDSTAAPSALQVARHDVRSQQQSIRKLETKYQLKIATPFSCVIFVLLAAPLGMNPLRSTSSIGFGLSMILVFVYYLLTTMAVNLSVNGYVPPVILAWIPNLLFTLYGVYLNGQFVWSSGK